MDASGHHRKLRIFVASPGDVAEERQLLQDVVDELNSTGNIANFLGHTLEVLDWRTHVAPFMGRPQDVILQQLPVEAWDIFVGMLWLRFGTPTGAVDPQRGVLFDSGTQEEFSLAYNAWKKRERPKILFYRCMRVPESLDEIDPDQFGQVNAFFKQFDADAEYPGLYQRFYSRLEFERRVRRDLVKLLIESFNSILKDRFGLDILPEEDLLEQFEAAWEGQSLLIDLVKTASSSLTVDQIQEHQTEGLLHLAKLLGNAQAALVCRRPDSENWYVATTAGVSVVPELGELEAGLMARFTQGDRDYVAFSADDQPADDPFYRIFAHDRLIENFPVWQGDQIIGFVAFASKQPLIDQAHLPLIKAAVRLLISLPQI